MDFREPKQFLCVKYYLHGLKYKPYLCFKVSIDISFIENGPVVYESIDDKQTNNQTYINFDIILDNKCTYSQHVSYIKQNRINHIIL